MDKRDANNQVTHKVSSFVEKLVTSCLDFGDVAKLFIVTH